MFGQLVCFVLGFMAAAGTTVTCFWNQWAITSGAASTSLLNSIWGFNGIWVQCLQYTTGQYQCDDYATVLFNLPASMNAIRAMMCIAICLTVIGCFVILCGMECSKFLEETPNRKRKMMIASGVLYAVAGALVLASSSWYTSMVVYEFFSFANQDNLLRYEMGAALYLGFVTAVICFLTTLMCCCMPGPRQETDKYEPSYPLARSQKVEFPVAGKTKDKYMDYV